MVYAKSSKFDPIGCWVGLFWLTVSSKDTISVVQSQGILHFEISVLWGKTNQILLTSVDSWSQVQKFLTPTEVHTNDSKKDMPWFSVSAIVRVCRGIEKFVAHLSLLVSCSMFSEQTAVAASKTVRENPYTEVYNCIATIRTFRLVYKAGEPNT